MRIVILGAGAIGGVIAGHLARAKREVHVIARGKHLEAIRANGLRVETPDTTFTVPIPTGPVEWRAGDVLLVAVKTQDLADALRELAAPVDVPILCMMNGVEAERIALRHTREVYGGCVMMPSTFMTPGVVQVWAAPVPGLFDIGRYPDGSGDGDAIAGELIAAGFDVEVRANVMKWKRGKLLANLMNGAEAMSGTAARTSELADRAKAEARAVFAAANLSCITDAEDAERRKPLQLKAIGNAKHGGGSTFQSLARGAGTLETDYLNGEIAMLGRLHGIATPVNEALQVLAAEAARTRAEPGALPLAELITRVDRFATR
ncbi:MAG TPA: 2-dehydropantoate 2-reductase N-terminal domain-containing protein [Kofleriaceae bacterium]